MFKPRPFRSCRQPFPASLKKAANVWFYSPRDLRDYFVSALCHFFVIVIIYYRPSMTLSSKSCFKFVTAVCPRTPETRRHDAAG